MLISSSGPLSLAAWSLGTLRLQLPDLLPCPQAWERAGDGPVLSQWGCRVPGLGRPGLAPAPVPTVTGSCNEWLLEAPAMCGSSLGTPSHRHTHPGCLARGAVIAALNFTDRQMGCRGGHLGEGGWFRVATARVSLWPRSLV